MLERCRFWLRMSANSRRRRDTKKNLLKYWFIHTLKVEKYFSLLRLTIYYKKCLSKKNRLECSLLKVITIYHSTVKFEVKYRLAYLFKWGKWNINLDFVLPLRIEDMEKDKHNYLAHFYYELHVRVSATIDR